MIAIGCDHAGYRLKEVLIKHLKENGYDIKDMGSDSESSVDYPVYAEKVADSVASGKCERGILVCGTGIGMSIAANKIPGIRAAVCESEYSAKMSREHNDANILCVGARVLADVKCKEIVDTWLTTSFGEERHKKRVDMMMSIQDKYIKK